MTRSRHPTGCSSGECSASWCVSSDGRDPSALCSIRFDTRFVSNSTSDPVRGVGLTKVKMRAPSVGIPIANNESYGVPPASFRRLCTGSMSSAPVGTTIRSMSSSQPPRVVTARGTARPRPVRLHSRGSVVPATLGLCIHASSSAVATTLEPGTSGECASPCRCRLPLPPGDAPSREREYRLDVTGFSLFPARYGMSVTGGNPANQDRLAFPQFCGLGQPHRDSPRLRRGAGEGPCAVT